MRPNIILIMSDNQPADLLGCYGNEEVVTPHIDRLARRGVRFSQAYCVNAMCSPCRASVLTGLMPSQHGVHNWLDDHLMHKWPDKWSAIGEFETLPSFIKQAGYATALIGKFHLGVPFEPQLAFDHWVTFPHGHTTSFYGNEVIDQEERYRFEGHSVDYFADKTVEFIDHQAGREEPFFAFVPFNGPYGHWPSIKGRAANEFAELYDETPMHTIPREGLSSEVIDRFGLRLQEAGGQLREQFKGPLLLPNNVDSLRNYFSQVSLIDKGVGRILAALEASGAADNTLVIYTADHGFSLGHNGIWGHGLATWPSTTHRPSFNIPLVMAGGPVTRKGVVCDDFVSQTDLFPTLTHLVGSDGRPSLASPARDIGCHLVGAPGHARDAVFMEQEETRAIRTDKWLYMKRFKDAPSHPLTDALYDLEVDPYEKDNIIGRADAREIVDQLSARIDQHFADYSSPEFDLWQGGSAKSNVSFEGFWKDAWGKNWCPRYS